MGETYPQKPPCGGRHGAHAGPPRCTGAAHQAASLPPCLRMGAVDGFGLRRTALPQPDGQDNDGADG
jgi:hypothetical protein